VLEAKKANVAAERSSRKEPLSDKDARELLRKVARVVVCKGKKSTEIAASRAKLADLKGPTGNYRAPMLVAGKTLLVGFNREALDDLF